ncbi:hypothetical protein NUBL23634_48590 [Klebsiella pneumoniae]|nr:hypothetical protein KP2269_50910 [Klebsiella pneumoniae]GKI44693.1 hypothetical protein NUBL13784_46890 [Klebsiella pneumoniae]GKI64833.1 hypothetical protein NUBL21975_49960 [Klebsiella pneumoniae]GKJ02543.1 hypothetical protein NUBL21978_40850 [Klebsiella pneumoniae]GKJ84216.1 hypothetical protein NUBL21984_48990 [Klebsiella pneumoniae]
MNESEANAIISPVICIEFVFSFKNKNDAIKIATGIFANIIAASPGFT